MIGQGDNGETIIFLGEGDVLMSTARQADREYENELVFSQDEAPRPIGAYTTANAGKTTAELASPVRLQFLKVESLDVLLERLHKVRAQMVASLGETDTIPPESEVRRQRDEISEGVEACHRLLDNHYGEDPGTTSLTVLEDRLKWLLEEKGALLDACKRAAQFITNGVELGYVTMPDPETPDAAHETLPAIRAAIEQAKGVR